MPGVCCVASDVESLHAIFPGSGTQYARFAPQCAGDCETRVAPRKEFELVLWSNMKICLVLLSQ